MRFYICKALVVFFSRLMVSLFSPWQSTFSLPRLHIGRKTRMFSVVMPAILGLCLSHPTAIGQACMTISNGDGEPGVFNVTVPNDFSQQNVSIPFNTSKSFDLSNLAVGETYQVVIQADGGFAALTISLNSDFVFSDGLHQEGVYLLSFSGPVTFSFKRVASTSCKPLAITVASLPNAEPGHEYSQDFSATGGVPPYTWSSSYSSLDPTVYGAGTPSGFTLDPNGGNLTGVGQHSNLYSLTISVQDSLQTTAQRAFSLLVDCSDGDDTDTDEDGLPDCWEQYGKFLNGTLIDLPAMGANSKHKDIFVQADYMECNPTAGCPTAIHTHKLDSVALSDLITAFAMAPEQNNPDQLPGIALHIDCGPDCTMSPGKTWGTKYSRAKAIKETNTNASLGTVVDKRYVFETDFDMLKSANFIPTGRQRVFHYAVLAHNLGGEGSTSGISRGGPYSDFIVSLGSWADQRGTTFMQAGTFMHELGHNLSLRHGGNEDTNYKPNYLSVMNYLFQTSGLLIENKELNLDYSKFLLPPLDKNHLNGAVGLNGGSDIDSYGTRYFCPSIIPSTSLANGETNSMMTYAANLSIDWTCHSNAPANINAGGKGVNENNNETILPGYDDWGNLKLVGGAIGGMGVNYVPPSPSVDEFPVASDANLVSALSVDVRCPGQEIPSGAKATITCIIKNTGTRSDTYTLTTLSSIGWAEFPELPSMVQLTSGSSSSLEFSISVPDGTAAGSTGTFGILATSNANAHLRNDGVALIVVISPDSTQVSAPVFAPGAGTFTAPQMVIISDATAEASIHYTTDGTTPTANSTPYSGPIAINSTKTIKAIAVASGYSNSPVASATYAINIPIIQTAATPTFSPAAGTFTAAQSVTISDTTSGATINYTTDGTTPTGSSTLYRGAITVGSTETVKALAVANGYSNSAVASVAYTINPVTQCNATINYVNGFMGGGLTLNGGAAITDNELQLTDGKSYEARSAFYPTAVPIGSFVTDFSFQLLDAEADGFTFVVQTNSPKALGEGGGGLGYAGIPNSAALKFDLHNNSGEGSSSTGVYENGVPPTIPSVDLLSNGIDLHSGHIFAVHLVYDGSVLVGTITDTVTKKSFTATDRVPVASVSEKAFVGFTGGTGRLSATQNILSWTYGSTIACSGK